MFLTAAALLDSVVNNHALLDDNKRLRWWATVVSLGLICIGMEARDDAAYDRVVACAEGAATRAEISTALESWAQG